MYFLRSETKESRGNTGLSLFYEREYVMGVLDRWTKKATTNAIQTTKETLNDKLETYSGIIKVELTLSVIIFGSKGINNHMEKKKAAQSPQALPYQQPIVINQYFDRGYVPNGRQGQNRQQHQNRR